MKNYLIPVLLAMMLSLFFCKDKDDALPPVITKSYDVVGQAQKGPFVNGSDVNIYELDSNFKPTGRTFHTNTDAKGYFELESLTLVSPYVELLADGFYFNEVTGNLSGERMVLKAIIDLSSQTDININVLTNLEFERVKYLISTSGASLAKAKKQAQKELLKVFSMDSIQVDKAELLDIAITGEDDAVLLAVSCILQANRSSAELSKLQADIILDMKNDGILSDSLLQSSLISQSVALNMDRIRQNLVDKYTELGNILTQINAFDKYIAYFNLHSPFHYTSLFEYPASTLNGTNALAYNVLKIEAYTFYSFAVNMPRSGSIKIKIKLIDGSGTWWPLPSGNYGWKVNPYDESAKQQTFSSTINGQIIDLPLTFTTYGTAVVEYYFKASGPPSHTKIISWGGYNESGFEFKENSPLGKNILALNDSSEIKSGTYYVMGVVGHIAFRLKFKVRFPDSVTAGVLGGFGHYSFNRLDGTLEIELASSEFGDTTIISGVSEIALKFTGKGKISVESNLLLEDGTYLKKTYLMNV